MIGIDVHAVDAVDAATALQAYRELTADAGAPAPLWWSALGYSEVMMLYRALVSRDDETVADLERVARQRLREEAQRGA